MMVANIIKVGNSKGIIIPSDFLKLIGFGDKVKIGIKDSKLIIEPIENQSRADWNKSFLELNSKKDTEILLDDVFEDESMIEDWTW